MRGFIDFETWEWTNPLCCSIVYGDSLEIREFHHDKTHIDGNGLAERVLRRLFQIECVDEWWAHNAGKFDGLFFSAAARRMGWEQSGNIAGGNRVISWRFKPRGSKRSVLLCDSWAVLPSKLGEIAKDFELPSRKLFTEEDYSIDTRKWEVNRLMQGCIVDAVLVGEALNKVETLINSWGGTLKHTFSSSAMSIILANLEERGLAWPTIPEQVNEGVRPGYYGARVEVFRHAPGEELSEYDINSSYPFAMTQNLPWNFAGECKGDVYYRKGYAGIYDATVTVACKTEIPCLPFVIENSGIYFPVGRWRALFPGNELSYAERMGVHVKIHGGYVYSQGKPFEQFIRDVYKVKQTAVGAVRTFSKLLLNGSYGKAGEKPEKQQLRVWADESEAIAYAMSHREKVTQLGKDPCICAVDMFRWPRTTHYALASYITAYARIHLHRLLVGSENPAYCDSDSVHCKRDGISKREVHNLLGGLKREIARGYGYYYAPKIYEIKDLDTGKLHLACKGFPVEETSFRKMISGQAVEKGRMVLAKSQLRRGGKEVFRTVDKKRWHGISAKRCAISKCETRPWSVKELEAGKHEDMTSPLYFPEGKYDN